MSGGEKAPIDRPAPAPAPDQPLADDHPGNLPWSVQLVRTGTGLRASVQGPEAPGPWEYAFYLMRGRERETVRWYSRESGADFGNLIPGERYHALGFVRRAGTSDLAFRPSEAIVGAERGYDLSPWNVAVRDHDEGASGQALLQAAGINRYPLDGHHTLDFLTQVARTPRKGQVLLVCFSAAIQRSVRAVPLFSGVRLASDLDLDLIAVSDPMLALHPALTLAWYAGSKQWPDLPQRIAALLDDAAQSQERPLILVGGSGAGFASLAVLEHLRSPAAALVWNPQTSISRYYLNSASAYARCASGVRDAVGKPSRPAEVARMLEAAGVTHDLTRVPKGSPHPVIYLQNRGDAFHLSNHLQPYAMANGFSAQDLAGGSLRNEQLCIEIGDWGAGHVSPPRRVLDALLRALADGQSSQAACELMRRL
ncbi:hypothetical protein [Ideonella sp. YS5]|uniref:hypothetical protein n=1 Tax=Ideonella sp. YS5 TaxID=3453714 RepID=UPI003EEFBC65